MVPPPNPDGWRIEGQGKWWSEHGVDHVAGHTIAELETMLTQDILSDSSDSDDGAMEDWCVDGHGKEDAIVANILKHEGHGLSLAEKILKQAGRFGDSSEEDPSNPAGLDDALSSSEGERGGPLELSTQAGPEVPDREQPIEIPLLHPPALVPPDFGPSGDGCQVDRAGMSERSIAELEGYGMVDMFFHQVSECRRGFAPAILYYRSYQLVPYMDV